MEDKFKDIVIYPNGHSIGGRCCEENMIKTKLFMFEDKDYNMYFMPSINKEEAEKKLKEKYPEVADLKYRSQSDGLFILSKTKETFQI